MPDDPDTLDTSILLSEANARFNDLHHTLSELAEASGHNRIMQFSSALDAMHHDFIDYVLSQSNLK